jgi:hypothetical protein
MKKAAVLWSDSVLCELQVPALEFIAASSQDGDIQ